MNEQQKSIDEYRELVRRLKGLLDDPQPGLSSWSLMFGATMNSLVALWHSGADPQEEQESIPTGNIAWVPTPMKTRCCVQLASGKWCQLMQEFRCGSETEWKPVEEDLF